MKENVLQNITIELAVITTDMWRKLESEIGKGNLLLEYFLDYGVKVGACVERLDTKLPKEYFLKNCYEIVENTDNASYYSFILYTLNYIEPSFYNKYVKLCRSIKKIVHSSINTINKK